MNKKLFLENCKKLVINFIVANENKVRELKKPSLLMVKYEVERVKINTVEGKHFDHLLKYLDNMWSIAKIIVYKD